jgi:phosphoglycerate dehydrogenase-like enzyme
MSSTTPSIFVAIPPSLYDQLFDRQSDQRLRGLGSVLFLDHEQKLTSPELARQITPHDIIITGWGAPTFTDEVLAAAPKLKLIAHSAGSIKQLLPPPVFARGLLVTHAASAIAPAVAELTLLLILLCLRNVHKLDRLLKAGEPWSAGRMLGMGQELVGQRVGVVGAGYTGRCVIRLLRALDCDIWVSDPYLSAASAAELGVHKAELTELLRHCPIVTLQAPPTQETYHMIGAHELRLLQDGAIFINTARAHLVDQAALLAELQRGRIQAALDVFDQEPLPVDHPLRQLENVILTPHVAGASLQARRRQGEAVVAEVERFLAGEPLHYRVTGEMLETMA